MKLVVLHSYKRVREALVEKGEHFADRPAIPLFEEVMGNKGRALITCCLLLYKITIVNALIVPFWPLSVSYCFLLTLICAAVRSGHIQRQPVEAAEEICFAHAQKLWNWEEESRAEHPDRSQLPH